MSVKHTIVAALGLLIIKASSPKDFPGPSFATSRIGIFVDDPIDFDPPTIYSLRDVLLIDL